MLPKIPDLSFPMLMAILAFCGVCLVILIFYQIAQNVKKRKSMLDKIKKGSVQMSTPDSLALDEEKKGFLHSWVINPLSFMGKKASRGITDKEYTAAKLKFLRAGIHHPRAVMILWGVKFLLSVSFVVVFLGLTFFLGLLLPKMTTVGLTLVSAIVGFYLPDIWLRIKTSKRMQELEKAFPDALDLLVICVEAGMGLDGAINRVAREIGLSDPAMSQEFRTIIMEVKAGKSREQALNNLGVRTNLEDVKNFVGLLVQTMRFGTSVADSLRVYSDSFRTKRRQKVEEKAAKLPLKLVFPSALFIFPALFVVILGPAVLKILEGFTRMN